MTNDKCLQTAELVSLKERQDQMCIQLIKSMSNSDHKLHNVSPKKVHEIRKRETRQNSHTVCITILNGELNVLKTVQLANCY